MAYDSNLGIPIRGLPLYGWPENGIPGGMFISPDEQWGGVPRYGIPIGAVPTYGILQKLDTAPFTSNAEQWGGVPRRGILIGGVPLYGILQKLVSAIRGGAGRRKKPLELDDFIAREDEEIIMILIALLEGLD